VCPSCVEEWEVHLGNVTVLVEDLELAQRKQAKFSDGGGSRSKPDKNIPLDDDDRILFADAKMPVPADDQTVGPGKIPYAAWASRVALDNRTASYWLDRLRNELVGQIRLICEVNALDVPELATTVAMSRWLLGQAGRIPVLPEQDGWGMVHDLDQMYRDCVDTIDAPKRHKYVKVCDCGLSVWARHDASETRCACGLKYDVATEHEARMVIARDSWVTIREAAGASGAKENTVWKWTYRKRLETHGTEPQRVRYGDVLDLAAVAKEATRRADA